MSITRLIVVCVLVASAGVQTAWAMGNHSDVVRDQYGRALGGATITVYVAGTTDLADIYSDNGVTAKENPLTSDTLDGRFNFYAANGVYDLVFSHPNATFDAAHTARISVIDASAVTGGSSTPVGLDDAFTVDPEITTATSANPMKVGNGTQKVEIFGDATMGGAIRPSPLGDSVWRCWTNFNCVIRDEEGAASMLIINPDAASPLLMYQFQSGYRPLKSVWIGAGNLYGDGTNCPERPTAVTINSGPKIPTFICSDNNSSRLTGMLRMPGDWDGGTIALTHAYIQTAADTNALNGDVAAQCRGAGETVSSTWGSEVAIDDAAVSGSNINDLTTSAAVTPAGTCAAGDTLYFYYEIDATGTTTAVATLHHLGFHLTYTSTSWSH